MPKRIFILFLLLLFFMGGCGEEEYQVDYDDEKIKLFYKDNKIIFENNMETPVILDNLSLNEKEIASFIEYKVCEYVKYKDEVVVNYADKLNQIIRISTIVLPGKKKEIEYTLKKGDEVVLEFYPVNYTFLSDNLYFINKNISEKEKRYKLYSDTDIKELNISGLEKKEDRTIIDGIMIFVKEYEALEDFLEEMELEIE